jgi:hypothetical protein
MGYLQPKQLSMIGEIIEKGVLLVLIEFGGTMPRGMFKACQYLFVFVLIRVRLQFIV